MSSTVSKSIQRVHLFPFLEHVSAGYSPAKPFLTCVLSFQLAFFSLESQIRSLFCPRGGLQGEEKCLMHSSTVLCCYKWSQCMCVLCDISENSSLLQNSSAELYCTLTDNLSVNVPRLSGRDAFRGLMLLWKLCVWTLGCFTPFHLTAGALQSPCSPNHNDTTPPLELLRWQNQGSFAVTSIKAAGRQRWINK